MFVHLGSLSVRKGAEHICYAKIYKISGVKYALLYLKEKTEQNKSLFEFHSSRVRKNLNRTKNWQSNHIK